MGACCCGDKKEASADVEEVTQTVKIALLGCRFVGKSTVKKQMRLVLAADGKHDDIRVETLIEEIRLNILDILQKIDEGMEKAHMDYRSREAQQAIERIRQDQCREARNSTEVTDCDEGFQTRRRSVAWSRVMDNSLPQLHRTAKNIWTDSNVQRTLQEKPELFDTLPDATSYFMENLDRICDDEYIPTDQDNLNVRTETVGITKMSFKTAKGTQMEVTDAGGHQTRKLNKWTKIFDAHKEEPFTMIIFVASLSEYYQLVDEADEKINRMTESLATFKQIYKEMDFSKTKMVLLLNKEDLFQEKIRQIPIRCFQDYTGNPNDPEEVSKFILGQYVMRVPPEHLTDFNYRKTKATDTKMMTPVLEELNSLFLQKNLSDV